MGLLDDLSGKLNRGAEITARTGKNIKLKAQLGEKKSHRNAAYMRLGQAVYAAHEENPDQFGGFEDLIKSIEDINGEIARLQMDIDRVAADAAASTRTYMVGICTGCGYRVASGDAYCSRCGTKVEAKAAPSEDAVEQDQPAAAGEEPIIDVDPVVPQEDQPSAKVD